MVSMEFRFANCCPRQNSRRNARSRSRASICEIADYVHSHGVVLRDLEPDHILVGENDQVKLIHVGVTSKLGARRLTFTKLSQVIGASQYISPEELVGKSADVRSDVYSIG